MCINFIHGIIIIQLFDSLPTLPPPHTNDNYLPHDKILILLLISGTSQFLSLYNYVEQLIFISCFKKKCLKVGGGGGF